jgi:clan AA aspartic protease (TIGR02281 family)
MPNRSIPQFIVFAVLSVFATLCQAENCEPERYFAPEDANSAAPLKNPHVEFRKTRELASQDIAAEERNLAVYYESGYLVTPCRDKAIYWYRKAATHGDDVAKAWMARHTSLERIRNNGECAGDTCYGSAANSVQKTVLRMAPGGSYTAIVRINGQTLNGIIDTGATVISMSGRTASELRIDYSAGRRVQLRTANGITSGRMVLLNAVSVGDITLKDVEAVVSDADHPLLVGMSFLRRLTITTTDNAMILVKP